MYNFKLEDNEEIKLIVDDVLICENNRLYTFIITNKRLLILDYPSNICNSFEDLRISGRLNYVKMKEIVVDKDINDIKRISIKEDMVKILFNDDSYIEFVDKGIYSVIKDEIR